MPTELAPPPKSKLTPEAFSPEQKEFLEGFLAAMAHRHRAAESSAPESGAASNEPAVGATWFGTPVADLCKQEQWKRELHGLDAWDRLVEHAEANKFPEEADNFRFRFHGLFHVAPAQNSFMLRCRIPAGELNAAQLRGLADISEHWGNAKAAITTRSNLQIREIAPANLIKVLTRLQQIGLTSRGSGVDNVRNITASPTAGFDPQELLDTRPFAHALHHAILNHRDLYDLPRKFNVAFEGGGSIDTVADTNDIGFMAVQVAPKGTPITGSSLRDGNPVAIEPGIYFRLALCGITGHKQLASDTGLLVAPSQAVAVSTAMIRVFIQHGDRTDRRKARLKYLIDAWGVPKFLEQTQKRLAFPLISFPLEQCQPRPPAIRHGHLGVYRQKQKGLNYIGVVIPVGVMTVKQMRRLADLAENYGSGQLRLTPWQNLLIPDVPDAYVETVKRNLVRMGFHHEANHVMGGLVACTGNTGCKWASTDTKGQAVALGRHLARVLELDQPINIHLTGCPNSCAQHYIGDIGLQGVKVKRNGEPVEGYNVVLGGGSGLDGAIGCQVFTGIAFTELPALLERVLKTYLAKRQNNESFAAYTRRHTLSELQQLFSE